jgi:hypothetical protein
LLLCPMDAKSQGLSQSRAKLSTCSFEEPNACKCPVAALAPASPADPAGYGPAGPSLLE